MNRVDKVHFQGAVTSVKARIRLLRSFDQIPSHQYQSYTLLIDGEVGGQSRTGIRIAVGGFYGALDGVPFVTNCNYNAHQRIGSEGWRTRNS